MPSMVPLEGKLVRDRIPEIILANGERPVTRTLKKDERRPYLHAKLAEEVAELADARIAPKVKEEISDVLEVLRALAREYGVTWEDVHAAEGQKRDQRGAFWNFTCLIRVDP